MNCSLCQLFYRSYSLHVNGDLVKSQDKRRVNIHVFVFCVFSCSYMTTPIAFIQQTYDELKKVVWPTREELIRLTGIVIIISIIVGLYIGGIDYVLTKLTETLLY